MDFGFVLEGLGEVLGRFWTSQRDPLSAKSFLEAKFGFLMDLGKVWEGPEGFGTGLGEFGKVLRRVWERFGKGLEGS